MKQTNVFKTAEGREAIRGYYFGILSSLPLIQRTVETAFTETFVLEAGSPANPPVILLHGSCSNSAAWLGDMPALAAAYHVFAVDIPGEPGGSEDRRLDFQSGEYPDWLLSVMDALGIQKAAVIGNSLGGWLALQFAAVYPEHTASLVMLAPSGISEPRAAFLAQIADVAENEESAKAANNAMTQGAALPKEVLEFMALVAEHFIPYTKALPVLTDAQMQRLTMPVLYIAGTGDITMDTAKAAQRLSRLVPHAQIQLKEGAHIITSAADEIIPFLAATREP